MALLLRGKTNCALCGKVITESDDVVAFPAFLGVRHPLNRFSDAPFHKGCFSACPERAEVEALYARFRTIWEGRPRDLKTPEELEAWGKDAFGDFK